MPLYEYRCEKCGREFESFRKLSDTGKDETCPSCGGLAERVRISLFRMSGSGSSGGSSCGGGSRRSPFG
ncbi:MAG: zinc ribbon domain-containing protein [Deltaproteobacteria bacterium]|nr:zinc ribbon domain-containing protein [Deltaproteobacteria bacterium]